MLFAIAAIAICLGGVASAQINPNDSGFGTKLGLMQLNNSGQIGAVTFFAHGHKTLARVQIEGAGYRLEAVAIHRGTDCDSLAMPAAYTLSPLRHGTSTSFIDAPESKLLSGNYNVVVFSSTKPGGRPVACGHLYR
jgi:hypothetical protein